MSFWFWQKRKKVGLALGGGVARGIAHIGVLKVLHNYKVPIDCIAGTSSGSIIAAAYAAGMDLSLLEQVALHIHWGELIKFSLFRPGFIDSQAVEDFIIKYIGDLNIADLKIPFAAVVTDIRTGKEIVITEGRVARAVSASTTFPGFFAPKEIYGRYVIDGGIASNLPVDAVRKLGAEVVIASDVIPRKIVRHLPKDPLQVFGRSLDLVLKQLSQAQAGRADYLIDLEMEEDIWHLDLHKAKKLITAGEVAAHRLINKIRKDLKI